MKLNGINSIVYDRYSFGSYIKSCREKLEFSLKKVSQEAGISAAYLSDIECGNRNAPLISDDRDVMTSLIEVLQIPIDQIPHLYDMAYASRGYYMDVREKLMENQKVRDFLRKAKDLKLNDFEWSLLENSLNSIVSRRQLPTFSGADSDIFGSDMPSNNQSEFINLNVRNSLEILSENDVVDYEDWDICRLILKKAIEMKIIDDEECFRYINNLISANVRRITPLEDKYYLESMVELEDFREKIIKKSQDSDGNIARTREHHLTRN